MRFCLAAAQGYVIYTLDIKQVDSPGYWPIEDQLCKYLSSFARSDLRVSCF